MFPDWQALVPSQLIQQTVSGKPAKDKMSGISGLVTIAAVLVHEISTINASNDVCNSTEMKEPHPCYLQTVLHFPMDFRYF